MTWTHRRFLAALAGSLSLHALAFLTGLLPPPPAAPQPVLQARLQTAPPIALPEPVPLSLPEPPKPAARKHRPSVPEARTPKTAAATDWASEVRKQIQSLDRRGLFYPEEAIARGLQGEALVLLILDESGNVVAARLERSSGHAILDEAALRAVRSLRSLPAAAPREAELPVRFRLR